MKRIFLAATALFLGIAMMAQSKPDDVMKVNTEKYDFGKIKQGVPVSTFFEITNISDKPLVIENSWGSCGCTTPEKIEKPIQPGETVKLKVNYNAAAAGHFEKDVYIKLAGIEQPKDVKITGEVVTPEQVNTNILTTTQSTTPEKTTTTTVVTPVTNTATTATETKTKTTTATTSTKSKSKHKTTKTKSKS